MRRKGFSLLEVMVAAGVIATVMLAMAAFQSATLKVNSKEKDRAFATQKAVQIMEEILAYQITAGTASTQNVDSLAQGDTEYSFKLTIDPNVSDPKMTLSGNVPKGGGYKFVRQVQVVPLSNEKGARRVTVAVYYGDGGSTAKAVANSQPLALVTNIVKAAAIRTQPTQVYDIYLVDIENVPGWWTDPNTLRQILANTIDFLKANNPGLEIRTHWVRRLGYGRDPYYTPISNKSQSADNTGAVPFNWVYFYPGKLTSTTMKYNPDVLKGQMNVDGTDQNALFQGPNAGYLPDAQVPYSFADEFNHAMRYPQEQDKYNVAVSAANHKNVPEMSLRMLLEQMYAGNLKNAIIVNLHAELIPTPPMRNYSDAAKVPRSPGNPSLIKSTFGVDPGSLTSAQLDEGSHARLVTHPRDLEVDAGNWTDLRVYPFKSQNYYTEPTGDYQNARVVVRGIKNDLYNWNNGKHSGNEENDVKIYAMVRDPNNPWGARFRWSLIWPENDNNYESAWSDIYLYKGNNGKSPPIVFAGKDDPAKDITKDDMIIRFKNINYTHVPLSFNFFGTHTFGLQDFQTLYGYNYFPDPNLPDLSNETGNGSAAEPRNTARFAIQFASTTSRRIDVLTTIGADEDFSHHQYPNRSETYQWVGVPAPPTERYQFVGDPRLVPYNDTRDNHRYNRYYMNWSNGGAYKNGGANGWNYFTASGNYVTQEIDLPRYFEIWRSALMNSNSIYLNPAGFSFYYYGMGGEVYSSVSGKPYGGSGLTWIDDIIGNTNGVAKSDNSWMAVPMLGELYPDDQSDNWINNGNLPAPTYQRKPYSAMPKWLASGGNNPDYNKRMIDNGCSSFFNGGDVAGNVYCHLGRTDVSNLTGNGQSVANNFKMYLDSSYPSYRPFILNTQNYPPDWTTSAGSRTTLQWGLNSGEVGYYVQASNASEIAVAPICIQRGGQTGYAVMSAAAPSGESGTTTLARLSMASALQAFFDLAAPTYRDGTNKGNNAPKLLPRLKIISPTEDTQLSGNSEQIQWELPWQRWDSAPYSTQHVNYGSNSYRPSMVYNIKYSVDGGTTWKFIDSPTTTAYAGVYDPNHAITGTSYNWNYKSWKNMEYLIRLEGYRDINGYRDTHYCYHQVAYTIAH